MIDTVSKGNHPSDTVAKQKDLLAGVVDSYHSEKGLQVISVMGESFNIPS